MRSGEKVKTKDWKYRSELGEGGISSICSHETRTMLNNKNDDDNNMAVAITNNGLFFYIY
jgi:hypothetical protein